MISLRQSLESKQLSVVNGLRSLHPFYVSGPADAFPKSIRMLIQSLEWPSGYTTTGNNYDYPKDREPGWSDNLQGVTHDNSSWYFTQTGILWRFPAGRDLNSTLKPTLIAPIIGDEGAISFADTDAGAVSPIVAGVVGLTLSDKLKQLGCYHLGACNYYQGMVYVPIEGSTPPLVVAIQVSESSILCDTKNVAPLTNQAANQAPWCAINPLNGMLYSSSFRIDQSGLSVYRLSKNVGLGIKLDFVGMFALFDSAGNQKIIDRVQGGCFSNRGHLYLVSDDGTGILGFDMLTGRQTAYIPVDYQPTTFGKSKEEIEDITIWDLDTGQSPGISGQLHLVMIDNLGSGADDLYFKHYKVAPQDKDKI